MSALEAQGAAVPNMLRHLLLIGFCSSLWQAVGAEIRSDCLTACRMSFRGVQFAGKPTIADGFWKEECGNDLHERSLLLCSLAYCDETDFEFNYNAQRSQCLELTNITIPAIDSIRNISQETLESYKTLEFDHGSDTLKRITLPTADLYSVGMATIVRGLTS